MSLSRRKLLATTALGIMVGHCKALQADVIRGALPFASTADPPQTAVVGPWTYFTPDEGAMVEALVDRLIPSDEATPGGKELGCAVFIDRQLAGPYGSYHGFYMQAPFHEGTKQQGIQSPAPPAEQYRIGLAALDSHCRATFKAGFVDLSDDQKDHVIGGLEDGTLKLEGVEVQKFFKLVLTDTQHGFLADPIYGGNKDMAAWKMIGFPGARYDYRDWVDRHNERYPYPPVGLVSHPGWGAATTAR